eukprot:scaffold125789_cov20-Tisochrysis_lutea.AAC.3
MPACQHEQTNKVGPNLQASLSAHTRQHLHRRMSLCAHTYMHAPWVTSLTGSGHAGLWWPYCCPAPLRLATACGGPAPLQTPLAEHPSLRAAVVAVSPSLPGDGGRS